LGEPPHSAGQRHARSMSYEEAPLTLHSTFRRTSVGSVSPRGSRTQPLWIGGGPVQPHTHLSRRLPTLRCSSPLASAVPPDSRPFPVSRYSSIPRVANNVAILRQKHSPILSATSSLSSTARIRRPRPNQVFSAFPQPPLPPQLAAFSPQVRNQNAKDAIL
jgi:hypothetical protein